MTPSPRDPEKSALAKNSGVLRPILLIIGIMMMVAAPILGIFPGPGGIILFALGAGLVLRNSRWARRQYVRLKRKFPAQGRWVDWGMRRKSEERRTKAKNKDQNPHGREKD